MKSISSILVMATYLAVADSGIQRPCDLQPCLEKFSLTGNDMQFCNATISAQVCIGDLLEGRRCVGSLETYAKQLQSRLERITLCICSSGDCAMSSLVLSAGVACLTYFMTSVK